jgi:importin subunit alpha-1
MENRTRIPEYRLGAFKNRNAMKQDELRRRREDVAVEIRKQKRRNLALVAGNESSDDEQSAPALNAEVSEHCRSISDLYRFKSNSRP